MAHIKIYKFESASEAERLIKQLDDLKGYPSSDGSTLTYCNSETYNDTIFIRHDDFIESVIGKEPTEIEIIHENPFN